MSIFDRITEERIRKAREEGKFDNLRGKGKPLNLDENPFEPEEWRTAHRLLKQNDFTLPWIEAWNTLLQEREALRRKMRTVFESIPSTDSPAWKSAREEFAAQVTAFNRRILEYNLSVPSDVFQKPLIDVDQEIRAALDQEEL